MILHEVMTPREIEQIYSLPEGSVRRDLSRGKFRSSEIRKSGGTWLITAREAHRVYAGELTFIPVKDDFEWVLDHVREELKNDTLNDLVRRVLDKPFMNNNDVKNLAGLYHEGLQQGIENGKYIPFAQWFYEHFEDRIEEVIEEMEKKERVKKAFIEAQGSDTDWSLAADKFVQWCIENNFDLESFDKFVEWISEDQIDDAWSFFFGYGNDFEKFADDWIEDHKEREEYLKFAKEEEE